MNRFLLLFLFAFITPIEEAYGRDIFYGSGQETFSIPAGRKTILRFDSPVKTVTNADRFIIEPADLDQPDYSVLVIEPRVATGNSPVTFFLDDGTAVHAKINVSQTMRNFPGYYRLRSKRSLAERTEKPGNLPSVGKLDFINALIRGDRVVGYNVRRPNMAINTGLNGVKARLLSIYTGGDFVGYVYELENITKSHQYRVDVRKLSLGSPNLAILSSIDRDTLQGVGSGKSKAQLVIVAKPAASHRDVILPVTWVNRQ